MASMWPREVHYRDIDSTNEKKAENTLDALSFTGLNKDRDFNFPIIYVMNSYII